MEVLLTGASGFLGRVIGDYIGLSHNLHRLSRSSRLNVDLSLETPFFSFNPEIVIHAAGLAHLTPSINMETDIFYKVNVIGTENLLRGLNNSGLPKSFVLISTVSVYGLSKGNLINEHSELKADDPYGKSKIQAEKLVLNWCLKHNVTCTILRLPLVVGINPPGNLGAMINGIKKGLYFNISGGSVKKSMVLASDVAKFILKASEVGGIYNLTDGYHPSFFELSCSLSYQLGKSIPKNLPYWLAKLLAIGGDLLGNIAPLNSTKLDKITSDLTFDDSKARIAFAWNPTPVLEGLKIS